MWVKQAWVGEIVCLHNKKAALPKKCILIAAVTAPDGEEHEDHGDQTMMMMMRMVTVTIMKICNPHCSHAGDQDICKIFGKYPLQHKAYIELLGYNIQNLILRIKSRNKTW